MRLIVNRILLLVVPCLLTSCTAIKLRNANAYYEEYAYADAIKNYESVLSRKSLPGAMGRLGDCYRLTGQSEKAELWYGKLVRMKAADPLQTYYYAEALMENAKYEEAKPYFAFYLEMFGGDERARRLLQSCDSIHVFLSDSGRYKYEPVSWNLDSANSFSPVFYRSGVVFVSDRGTGNSRRRSHYTGQRYLDLFYVRQTSMGNWLPVEPLRGNINGAFNEGPATFSTDFNTIYFTRNDYTGRTAYKNQKSINNLQILKGSFIVGEWSITADLPFNSEEYSTAHPALAPSGDRLYFISDMPWGYGGTDLYYSDFADGKWSQPVNMGEGINTAGNELFPYLPYDSVLYFSSDGNYGLGGLDVFQVTQSDGLWSTPFNPGYPINSSKDDFGFIVDSLDQTGFFTSKRAGYDKIYSFIKYPVRIELNGKLAAAGGDAAVPGADLVLTTLVGQDDTTALSGNDGQFFLPLATGHTYRLSAKKKGYYYKEAEISTRGIRRSTSLSHYMELDPIKVNERFRYYDIPFTGKTSKLDSAAFPKLDSLVTWLQHNPELKVAIECHTDARGNDRNNWLLSRNRARAVSKHLSANGVHSNRLSARGYGETRLLNSCVNGILCLDEDHAVNERTEVRIVSYQ